jgi:hypothetical protein
MSSVGIHAANQKGSGPFDTSYLSPRAWKRVWLARDLALQTPLKLYIMV